MRHGRGKRILRWLTLLVLGGALLAVVGVAQSAKGKSVLRDVGIIGGEERYTALAFSQPRDLPSTIAQGARTGVGFTIRNVEGTLRTYRWRVVASGRQHSSVLASGRLRVRDGQVVRRVPRVRVPCTGRSTRVTVVLADPAESIGFWTQCTPVSQGGLHG
jgi:hypothetical protein